MLCSVLSVNSQEVLNSRFSSNVLQAQHQMNRPYPFWPQTASDTYFELKLKRATLVQDTFEQLGETYHVHFKKPLVVNTALH